MLFNPIIYIKIKIIFIFYFFLFAVSLHFLKLLANTKNTPLNFKFKTPFFFDAKFKVSYNFLKSNVSNNSLFALILKNYHSPFICFFFYANLYKHNTPNSHILNYTTFFHSIIFFFNSKYYLLLKQLKTPIYFLKNFSIQFSPTDFFKILSPKSLSLINTLFLRKLKIFNKGRYSRNRQYYRTGVYWCLYINIIAVIGIYFWFYRFNINFGYLWWLLFFFFFSFFFAKILNFNLFFYKFLIISIKENVTWFFLILINNFKQVYFFTYSFFKNLIFFK